MWNRGVCMYQKWIEEVLENYDMLGSEVTLIRHNENMTYQVDDKYLLRIHKHADGFSTDPLYDGFDRTEIYRSELAFLSHLESQGIKVQVPIPNKRGESVTLLTNGTPASLLTWIPGHTIDKSELTPELCYQIGKMIAKLHEASRNFKRVQGLAYDEALCERLQCKLYKLESSKILDAKSTSIMVKALDVIADEMRRTKQEEILVHADLSLSNMLITESELVPIDFSLAGYCHPMMDIAALYCNINGVENRSAIATGYKALGGTIEFHALDCYFALNILLGVILHCESWTKQDWFPDRLERWCRETFGPLGEGKALISTDFYMLNAK
jgi:Ser/Thr protein kinase RdoA (MazF antagonist)